MKKIFSSFLLALAVSVSFIACDKKDDLNFFEGGSDVTLTASKSSVAPAAADSSSVLLDFTWTNPGYATDASTVKYVLQVDTASNFNTAVSKTVMGEDTITYLAKDWNSILLGFGLEFNKQYNVYTRLVTSYANNNDQKISNTVTIQSTPYKVPPKIALPSTLKLFIVGGATQGGWNNPVPTPSQELARVSETKWAGVFNMNGAGEFLILPTNGDWNSKYSVASNSVPGINQGGNFGFNLSDNFKGPDAAGWYSVELEFQTGVFSIKPYTGIAPDNLWITGSAVPSDWTNAPPSGQQFTRLNSVEYVLPSVTINGGTTEFKFVPVSGSWDNLFGADVVAGDKLSGTFQYAAGGNIPSPAAPGNYKVEANMFTKTYKLTKL